MSELDELKRLLAEGRPGPKWSTHTDISGFVSVVDGNDKAFADLNFDTVNAQLIAEMRCRVPRLIAELATLRSIVEAAKAWRAHLDDGWYAGALADAIDALEKK